MNLRVLSQTIDLGTAHYMRAQGGPQKLRFSILSCSSEDAVREITPRASGPLLPRHTPVSASVPLFAIPLAGWSSSGAAVSQPADPGLGVDQVRRKKEEGNPWPVVSSNVWPVVSSNERGVQMPCPVCCSWPMHMSCLACMYGALCACLDRMDALSCVHDCMYLDSPCAPVVSLMPHAFPPSPPSRWPTSPQEILIKLEHPSKVQQIQILSHEYKVRA